MLNYSAGLLRIGRAGACLPLHAAIGFDSARRRCEQRAVPAKQFQVMATSVSTDPRGAWSHDPDRPSFHIMPQAGWLNDPNGPIYYKGRYHVFYQHVEGSSKWDWHIVWGHVSSPDMVRWTHEPIALSPSVAGHDKAGCWSGNTTLDESGVPTILYTAVRLRSTQEDDNLPAAAVDLGLEMIECQMGAQCRPGDEQLVKWDKLEQPLIPHPPDGRKLTGFRDPFVFQKGGKGSKWKLIVGSGVKDEGGTILLYHSDAVSTGWHYQGDLTNGKTRRCLDGADWDTGAMWECPFFVQLSSQDEQTTDTHMLCVSPYPHHVKDRPTNPCLYWLGPFQNDTFSLEHAGGPWLLDLGSILYAPTTFRAADGRLIMVAWLQELREGGGFAYAGCLSVPRLLHLAEGQLYQEPVPEVARLRADAAFQAARLQVSPQQPVRVAGLRRPCFDLRLTLQPGPAGSAAGVLLRPWLHVGSGAAHPCAAAILLTWQSDQPLLEAIFPEHLDEATKSFDLGQPMKRFGGKLRSRGRPITLRLLVDHSCVEVFTSTGQTLTTRVYRDGKDDETEPQIHLVSHKEAATFFDVEAFNMNTIWDASK